MSQVDFLKSQFNITIINAIQISIKNYTKLVSEKFNLNEDELLDLWYDENKTIHSLKKNDIIIEEEDYSNDEIDNIQNIQEEFHKKILKASCAELKAICKQKGLKSSGKKSILIDRILNGDKEIEKSKKSKKKAKSKIVPKIIKKLSDNISTIQIRKNEFGNYVHSETQFIFSKDTQQVIGKQEDNGEISDLTKNDIDICNKYKFAYILPENLNEKNIDDIKIQEMEDNEENEENEENLIEEELEDDEEEELEDEDFSDFYE